MNESELLAGELEKALSGGAWHGSSLRELLDGVTRHQALERPIPGAHSIADIVLHIATWHDVVRRRLEGETPQVSDAEDWPPVRLPADDAWSAAVERLLATGRALCEAIRRFPAERIHEQRPGLTESYYLLIAGELQHDLYHAGQIGILKKAAPART